MHRPGPAFVLVPADPRKRLYAFLTPLRKTVDRQEVLLACNVKASYVREQMPQL